MFFLCCYHEASYCDFVINTFSLGFFTALVFKIVIIVYATKHLPSALRDDEEEGTDVGSDTVLDVWYPRHGVIHRGDVCDDGFLVWMGNIHICG